MSRGRILVVDDDRETCLMLQEALSHRKFEVSWCSGPAEALRYVEQATFDAVLSDLRIGEDSGLELAKHIAIIEPSLPVLVITGFGSIAAAVEAMRSGAYDF